MFVFTICFEEKCDDLLEYYLLFSNSIFDSAVLIIASKHPKQSSSGERTTSRAHPEGNLPEPGELAGRDSSSTTTASGSAAGIRH